MELKYQSEIDKLSPCFIGFNEVTEKTAYRWVFEDINHRNNFLPPPLANSSIKVKYFTDWAISFFESEIQAKDKFSRLLSNKPKIYEVLGTHIARGTLNLSDGLCESICDPEGHFDHFEYKGVDFAPRFTIIKKMVEKQV